MVCDKISLWVLTITPFMCTIYQHHGRLQWDVVQSVSDWQFKLCTADEKEYDVSIFMQLWYTMHWISFTKYPVTQVRYVND